MKKNRVQRVPRRSASVETFDVLLLRAVRSFRKAYGETRCRMIANQVDHRTRTSTIRMRRREAMNCAPPSLRDALRETEDKHDSDPLHPLSPRSAGARWLAASAGFRRKWSRSVKFEPAAALARSAREQVRQAIANRAAKLDDAEAQSHADRNRGLCWGRRAAAGWCRGRSWIKAASCDLRPA